MKKMELVRKRLYNKLDTLFKNKNPFAFMTFEK